MKIDPWVSLVIKIILALLPAIATAATSAPQYFGGHDVAGMITFWAGFAATIIGTVNTILGTGAVASNTVIGKVACWILVAVVAATLFAPSHAEAATVKKHRRVGGNILPIPLPIPKPTNNPLTDLNKAFAAIQAISLDDLQAAKADADANKDALASPCYGALIGLVQAQQSVDMTKLEGKPHVVLTFQRGRDLFNALRPGSMVSIACSPLAEQVKMDITTLIASVAAGTVTMASFGL